MAASTSFEVGDYNAIIAFNDEHCMKVSKKRANLKILCGAAPGTS